MENRTEEKWRRLENGEFEQVATGKVRTGRDGKPRRPPKRRPSEDIRRDQMVEAVLRESKRMCFHSPLSFPADIEQLTTSMHKHLHSRRHAVPRTTTKPYLHSFKPSTMSQLRKHGSNNANLQQPRAQKAQPKRPRDQSLVARRAYEQRCVWRRNKQQRARSNAYSTPFLSPSTGTFYTLQDRQVVSQNRENIRQHELLDAQLKRTCTSFYTPAIIVHYILST